LRLLRQSSGGNTPEEPTIDVHQTIPSKKLGYGRTQAGFERLAREVMLAEGQPLETYEVVEILLRRGTSLGGSNEWKTASNRLWRGKQNGVFEHRAGQGYWLAGVPSLIRTGRSDRV
jgi:hypothetical protein